MTDIFVDHPLCPGLDETPGFSGKITRIYNQVQADHPEIARISVILYDPRMNLLSTFAYAGQGAALEAYACSLDRAGSLKEMIREKKTRVVNDLALFENGENPHTRAIAQQGFRSSLTIPLFDGPDLVGVVFFNAFETDVFKGETLSGLCHYAQVINCLVLQKLTQSRMLVGAFRGALGLVAYKDPETGNHLERMARYARLIARDLADRGLAELDDETIACIYLFAPLHDIGKIGIPDHILMKPGKLDHEEWEIMQTHSRKGRKIIDAISGHLGSAGLDHISLLRNISGSHHETIDGQGYPDRLARDDIPIETQIVTTADIFDALTSERPYKKAWSNDQAFEELSRLSGSKLNPDCVRALTENIGEILTIQAEFRDADIPAA